MLDSYNSLVHGVGEDYPLVRQALLHHRNLRREPMSLSDRPSLVEFFTDFPNIEGADICKATQVSVTETLILMSLYEAGWEGRIVAYVMSTAGLRNRLVKNRINPLLMSIPAYAEKVPPSERSRLAAGASSLRSKEFGQGQLVFLGSNTQADFVEFSADTMIVDEYDLCVEANIAQAIDRIREGRNPRYFNLGNPDAARRGIHRLWMEGDRRRFTFVCEHCEERQPILWYVNVVERNESGNWVPRDRHGIVDHSRDLMPVCRRCKKPFERKPAGAAWVAERPHVERRSYLMSRLDSLTQTLRSAWGEFVKAQGKLHAMVAFHRGMLGEPYEAPDARFNDEMLLRLCEDQPEMVHPSQVELTEEGESVYEREVTTAGIDVGSLFHVQVSQFRHPIGEDGEPDLDSPKIKQRIFVGTREHEDEVVEILKAFAVDTAVIDAGPETRISKYIQEEAMKFGCVVWLHRFFPTERVGDQDFGMKPDYRAQLVSTDRTQTFDTAFAEARMQHVRWPSDVVSVLGWLSQMKEPQRSFDEKKGRFIWTKGVDHFHLANVYDTVASELEQQGGGYFSL